MCAETGVKPCGGRTPRVTTLPCPALRGEGTAGESASRGWLGTARAVLVGVASRDAASWRLLYWLYRVTLVLSGVGIW